MTPGDASIGGAGVESSAGASSTAGSLSGGKLGDGGDSGGGDLGDGGGSDGGDLGDGGSGDVGITSDGYSFMIVPGAPPVTPPAGWSAADLVDVGTNGISVSDDGALIVGTSTSRYRNAIGFQKREEQLFVWTVAAGSKPLQGYDFRVARNGTAIFVDDLGVVSRWTASEGSQVLTAQGTDEAVRLVDCSPDGNVLVALDDLGRPLIWRKGVANDQLVPIPLTAPLAEVEYLRLSPEGSMLLVTGRTSQDNRAVATWAIGPGSIALTHLVSPAAPEDCTLELSSLNGAVLAGSCGELDDDTRASDEMFRYQAGDAALQLIADGPSSPSHISADGMSIVGTNGSDTAKWWTPAGTVEARGYHFVSALSEDATTAWLGRFYDNSEMQQAARWTRTGGAVPVELLPGSNGSRVFGVAKSGSHFVGAAGTDPDSRAVLWDDHGVRDIAAELTTAGIDVRGTHLLEARFVWELEETIRVIGSARLGKVSYHGYTWLATLPKR